MHTSSGVEIAGPYHKYDGPMAMYLDDLACQGVADNSTGDVDSIGCFALFGKHIISENELGFVVHHKFLTDWWALTMFRALEVLDSEWHEEAEPDQLDVIAWHRSYAFYVFASAERAEEHTKRFGFCQFYHDDLYTYGEWLLNRQPSVHGSR